MSLGCRHHPRHHLRRDHRPVQRRLLWGRSDDGGEVGDISPVSRSALTLVKCKKPLPERERERERGLVKF